MKDNLTVLVLVIFVVCIFVGAIWWTVYKYKDCKAVGHSTLYCIGKIAEK